MRIQTGNMMLEVMFVVAAMALMGTGLFAKYGPERREAQIEITRANAHGLLQAAADYWSGHRVAPPSVSALISDGLYDVSRTPTNPLGGPFAIRIDNIGAGSARVVVSATITESGTLTDWQQRLGASAVVAGGLEWYVLVREQATLAGIRSETFRTMY